MEHNVNHIVVDLEWNPVSKANKKNGVKCKNEIIEIGAVLLDGNYREIDRFHIYVKPEYNSEVTNAIRNLTGITTAKLKDAISFKEALFEFVDWCKKTPGDYRIYQWSDNDLRQIRKEMQAKDVTLDDADKYILSDWYDFQEEFMADLGIQKRFKLSEALFVLGVEAKGKAHSALSDACNTGRLMKAVKNPEERAWIVERVKSYFTPKNIGSTLGEMFNLEQFISL
jgi:inhibitor of KinA sporulation pathway (predicted exonuclease)